MTVHLVGDVLDVVAGALEPAPAGHGTARDGVAAA